MFKLSSNFHNVLLHLTPPVTPTPPTVHFLLQLFHFIKVPLLFLFHILCENIAGSDKIAMCESRELQVSSRLLHTVFRYAVYYIPAESMVRNLSAEILTSTSFNRYESRFKLEGKKFVTSRGSGARTIGRFVFELSLYQMKLFSLNFGWLSSC